LKDLYIHQVYQYRFDPSFAAEFIVFDKNNKSADTKSIEQGILTNWNVVASEYTLVLDDPLFRYNYCEFEMEKYDTNAAFNSWKVIVGIVSTKFKYAQDYWIGCQDGWGFIAQNGNKIGPICSSEGKTWLESGYGLGDVVGVLVHVPTTSISYFRNGEPLGIAWVDLPLHRDEFPPFRFAVALSGTGFKVGISPGTRNSREKAAKWMEGQLPNFKNISENIQQSMAPDTSVRFGWNN